jgi:hypothetical protein
VPIKLKLSRKLSFALVATLALLGFGGVTAAQVITINNNVSLNMGSGAIGTATCDRDISISGSQTLPNQTGNPANRYMTFVISNINLTEAPTGCGGQILRLVVIDDVNISQQASWTLPTRSDHSTISFTFGTTSLRTYVLSGSAGTYNASLALASVSVFDMKQIAIGISSR